MFISVLRNTATAAGAGARKPAQSFAVRALHATSPVREEEKAVAAPASGGFLSDWRVQVPIGFLAAIPLVQLEVFVINEETQLLGCFMVFVGTMYSQAGDAIGKMLDVKGQAVMAEHNAQEEIAIAAARSVLGAHQKKLTLVADMQMVYTAQSELLGMLAAAKSMELQYMLRADIVKKLDFLAMKEDMAKSAQQGTMVTKASAAVKAKFESDKDLQGKALSEALDKIADPNKASEDVVGKLFSGYFKDYASKVKSSTGEIAIPAEVLEAANAEILALRKRSGNDDTTLTGFPQKYSLA
jgi:hypothetical protein